MKWFRFYSEALEDPKIQRLPVEIRWRWAELLCLANRGTPRGTLPSIDDIAFALRLTSKRVEDILEKLTAQGLIDDDGAVLSPHNWNIRQPESDDAAERVRNKRRTNTEQPPKIFPPDKIETREDKKETRPEEDTDKNKTPDGRRPIFSLYENRIAILHSPTLMQELGEAEDEYPWEWIPAAFDAAEEQNKLKWSYVRGILREWKANGKAGSNGKNGKDPEADWLDRRYATGRAMIDEHEQGGHQERVLSCSRCQAAFEETQVADRVGQ